MPVEEGGNETVFVQLTPNQAQVPLFSTEESKSYFYNNKTTPHCNPN